MEVVRVRRREGELQCPFCHEGFSNDDQVVSCGGCTALYHGDCLRDELRSCASLGCEVRPELGKAFRWEDRAENPGLDASGQGLRCCSDPRPGEPIVLCQGCGGLSHTSCLGEDNTACCEGHETVPLLRVARKRSSILGPAARAWFVLALLLVAGLVVRVEFFGAALWEIGAWIGALVILLCAGLYGLYMALSAREPA